MKERRKELESKGMCVNWAKHPSIAGFKYCQACASRRKQNAKRRLKIVRQLVLEKYGKHCACCGESEPGFLTIDHINNDGWKERRPDGGPLIAPEMIYRKLAFKPKRNDIQILCYNCNCAKQRLGYCPHKPEKRIARRLKGARSGKMAGIEYSEKSHTEYPLFDLAGGGHS